MAEMPKHEAGDAVFVREEQHQMPYSAKVHDLPKSLFTFFNFNVKGQSAIIAIITVTHNV